MRTSRKVVDLVLLVIYDGVNIFLAVMQLLSDMADRNLIIQDMLFWFQQLFVDMAQALKSLGDMIFKILYEISGSGGALKIIIKMICNLIRFIINDIWAPFLCKLVEQLLPPALDIAIQAVEFVKLCLNIITLGGLIPLPTSAILDALGEGEITP